MKSFFRFILRKWRNRKIKIKTNSVKCFSWSRLPDPDRLVYSGEFVFVVNSPTPDFLTMKFTAMKPNVSPLEQGKCPQWGGLQKKEVYVSVESGLRKWMFDFQKINKYNLCCVEPELTVVNECFFVICFKYENAKAYKAFEYRFV